MSFWNYGKFVDWEGCIEANRLCNLQYCPETMNCCSTNCMGIPTISGVLLLLGIAFIFTLLVMIFSILRERKEQQ